MNSRDWSSNAEELYRSIPNEDQSARENLKILGLVWNLKEVVLTVLGVKHDNKSSPGTKRRVLQRIASVFDPLGYFTLVTLNAKLFLQALWQKNLEWDAPLSEEVDSDSHGLGRNPALSDSKIPGTFRRCDL